MPKLTVELPEKNKTTKVMYADAPLRLNGVPREITIEELYHKVSHPFIYSDSLFSNEKHAPYLKKGFKPATLSANDYPKKFEQLGFTEISSFVICNTGSLGHGVFAGKDFEPGECFILYAGVITDNAHSEIDSLYAFAYGSEITLAVDAADVGNISRFIQHMPLNFNLASQNQTNKQGSDKELSDFWQWRNLDYKLGLTEAEVAWANLSIMVIPLEGVPCIILYNTQKINKGDQLGTSYGSGYWRRRKMKPELFDLKGDIIPKTKYGYKEVVIDLPLIELFNQLPQFKKIGVQKNYTASMFQKDLQRQQEPMQPVWFSHFSEPVSIFKLRELLLEYNVIGNEYAHIEKEFILELRNILSREFKIKMYERDPHHKLSKPIYDVVCTTEDLMEWSKLTVLIKNPRVAQTTIQSKCLKLTQEVIIMDIGSNLENQSFLLNVFTVANMQGFFASALPRNLIPSGPTRGDTKGILMAKSAESISQILLHNPGLTREEINDAYKHVEALCDPTDNSNAKIDSLISNKQETRLNTITSSFFKNETLANWKVYPPERLKGKYIGHQVRFFNIPAECSTQAAPFFNVLKQNGFEGELIQSGKKPSIVIDLNTSKKMHI